MLARSPIMTSPRTIAPSAMQAEGLRRGFDSLRLMMGGSHGCQSQPAVAHQQPHGAVPIDQFPVFPQPRQTTGNRPRPPRMEGRSMPRDSGRRACASSSSRSGSIVSAKSERGSAIQGRGSRFPLGLNFTLQRERNRAMRRMLGADLARLPADRPLRQVVVAASQRATWPLTKR